MGREVTVIPARRTRQQRSARVGRVDHKIRVAAYCRVSTEQEEQQNSFANQVRYYTDYINSRSEYELVDIYADEGISGTGTKKRTEFNRMIEDCEAHKIDLVITKSISRFARNTQDCLNYTRRLKNLGVNVIFEKENINLADNTGELLLTILGSLAQEESRNISENCKWGIRSRFQKGIPHLNTNGFMGYDKDDSGNLIIDPAQAKIVRRIFRDFEEGWTASAIANALNKEGVCGVRGKPAWNRATILAMLQNEKYKGDLLLQKVYTADYLTKKLKKNNGEITQYYVEDAHKAIIPAEEWEAVQQEIQRRHDFMKGHGLTNLGHSDCSSPFVNRVFCGGCGGRLGRKSWKSRGIHEWVCRNKEKAAGKTCHAPTVKEEDLRRAMVITWNDIVNKAGSDKTRWDEMIETGDALEKMRARQMKMLVKEGTIKEEIPELTRMVIEHIDVLGPKEFRVHLLDGSERHVCVQNYLHKCKYL